MKKIVGAKEHVCDKCNGTMVFLKVKGIKVVSQCLTCGNCMSGRVKDQVKVYLFDKEGNYECGDLEAGSGI